MGDTDESDAFHPDTDAPTVEKHRGYYELHYAAYNSAEVEEWLETIKQVTVNDTAYTKVDGGYAVYYDTDYFVYSAAHKIILGSTEFDEDTDNIVVLSTAAGDLTLKITSTLQVEILENEGGEQQPDETMAAPDVQSIKKVEEMLSSYYRLEFALSSETEQLHQYLSDESIAVTIHGEPVQKATFWWGVNNAFRISGDDSGLTPDMMCFVDFSEDCFEEEGVYAVVISVSGYEDLAFTVVNQDGTVSIGDAVSE